MILFGSLTSLSRVGLQSYASACINGKRRISGVAKKCEVIPFIPPPLGGCNDPELIRNIVDSCVWLGSIQSYALSGTAKVLVDLVMDDVEGGEGGPKHLDHPVFLPHSLDSYDGTHVTSPGRPGIPAFVPSWSQADEKKYLSGLIKDLNENLLAGLDPNPNLSRSKVKPQMYPAVRSGSVERIVFVGGSHAKNLSQAASILGIDSYMIATGGWKITRENIDKLIPDLHELMSGLPIGTPIVLFCMDNSSFLAASEDGGMAPISKCVEGDHGYHVKGALVVAPERALQFAVDQLKRVVDEFVDFDVFIITPVTRYAASPCCTSLEHVTNFGDPDFLSTIISDLTKLKFQLRKKFQPAVVIDGIELACGSGCGREKVEQTLRAGWALDPVHPNGHIYAKMALNLIEKVGNPANKPDSRKRKRSDDSSSGSGSQAGGGLQRARPRSDSGRERPRESAPHRNQSSSLYNQTGPYRQEFHGFPTGYQQYRGRGNAGSVSSRGSAASGYSGYGQPSGSGRGGGPQGFRGGFRGGFGNRGSPRGRAGQRFGSGPGLILSSNAM
jgi:hypothetical protein